MTITISGTTGITGASWTTSGRPTSPVDGQQGYNTTLEALEVYIDGNWEVMAESA